MKQYLTNGALALVLGGFLTSCSHEEFDISTYVADKVKTYEQVFIKEFGTIDPEQDWGFGTTATEAQARSGLTRAAATWDGKHNCAADWSKLNFTKPEGATDLTRSDLFPDGNNLGSQFANITEWYIPADFNGSLSLHNMNLKGNVYVLGKLTDLQSVSCNGVTFYIAKDARMKYTISTGGRQNIVNAGNLEVAKWSNVGELYNGGTLTITDTDVHNDAKIYSNGEATIEFPYGGDLKSTCDIHGTINVTGNLKIQNSTSKYICGIKATGTVENVDGPFYTSYVEADKFTVDGNETYLLAGGHIKANTVHVYNSGCSIKAAAGSTALIEAKDFIFANDNDFERTVSDNVYFHISGSVDVSGVTNGSLKERKKFDNAEAYIAANGNPNDKLNAGYATGSPACGNAWSVGTPEGENIPVDDAITTEIVEKFYKTIQLIEQGRVFCEDLGSISSSDLDFNDVVFDAYIYKVDSYTEVYENGVYRGRKDERTIYENEITLWAAGGTLALQVAGEQVKNKFNTDVAHIVNTAEDESEAFGNPFIPADPVTLYTTGYERIKDIPIVVQYGNGTVHALESSKGAAPHKILVPIGTQWARERGGKEQGGITKAYPKFAEYVSDSEAKFWEDEININFEYLYPAGGDVKPRSTEPVTVSNGEDQRTDKHEGGGYNGTPVLSRERR